MSACWERIAVVDATPVLGPRGTPLGDVITRLERGETPASLAQSLELDALDLVAAVAYDAIGETEENNARPPTIFRE